MKQQTAPDFSGRLSAFFCALRFVPSFTMAGRQILFILLHVYCMNIPFRTF